MLHGTRRGLAALIALAAGGCGDDGASGPEADRTARATDAADEHGLAIDAPHEAAERAEVALVARATPPLPASARYQWRQLPGGPRVVLSGWNTARASFRAPEDTADYTVSFEVEATLTAGALRAAPVEVRVRCEDDPPEAEAYAPASAECGALVVLQGQGRSYEQRQALSFEWRQVGQGPRTALESADRPQASFVAPESAGPYALEFELHVRDGVNPDAIAKARVEIECDPGAAPLAAGEERTLVASAERLDGVMAPAERSFALPRGAWRLAGVVTPRPTESSLGFATATLRFEYSEHHAAAIELRHGGAGLAVRTLGLQRADLASAWSEPESSGERPHGDVAIEPGVGFTFDWDGRELGVRFGPGPPGDPASEWPAPEFPISFPLAARPRVFAVDVRGFAAEISGWSIAGR